MFISKKGNNLKNVKNSARYSRVRTGNLNIVKKKEEKIVSFKKRNKNNDYKENSSENE